MGRIIVVMKNKQVEIPDDVLNFIEDNHQVRAYVAPQNLTKEMFNDVDLVIVYGGDGTLLRTTHFITNECPIMGINRGHVGHFLNTKDEDVIWAVTQFFEGKPNLIQYNRLATMVETATGLKYGMDRAFNDVAIGNPQFYRKTKYKIGTNDNETMVSHKSSGLLAATKQGMTGWVINTMEPSLFKSLVDEYEKTEDGNIFYTTREPMDVPGNMGGYVKILRIKIETVECVVAIDGNVGFLVHRGDEIQIRQSRYPIYVVE